MSWSNYDLVVFEDAAYADLLPLTYWRTTFELRCGTCSLLTRIARCLDRPRPILFARPALRTVLRERGLGEVVSQRLHPGRTLFVNGRYLMLKPLTPPPANTVGMVGPEIAYVCAEPDLAARLTADTFLTPHALETALAGIPRHDAPATLIRYPWNLVHQNLAALLADWAALDKHGNQGRVYPGAHLLAEDNIVIGPGSVIKPGTVLDAEPGPIIIGANVTIRPNCTLEGPLYIGDGSLIQPGAVINEGVSIGPVCKVGGELESSIIHAHSNKQHDGFLGHSYIGEWVNLAADTINSDLKNTYGPVRVPINGREVDSGEMFVGLTMGDHSKTSVNTMFRTGAVVGFACSVFTSRFSPRFLPSFSWLTDDGRFDGVPEKLVAIAEQVMARRKVTLTEAARRLFLDIRTMAAERESLEELVSNGLG